MDRDNFSAMSAHVPHVMPHSPSARHHAYEDALAPISDAELDAALRALVANGEALHADLAACIRCAPTGRTGSLTHQDHTRTVAQRDVLAPANMPLAR